jgi:GNAT superfamily N-acetyltransferase
MARNERELRLGELAVDDVQVGPADAAGVNPQQDLPGTGLGSRELCGLQGRASSGEHHRTHGIGNLLAVETGEIVYRRLVPADLDRLGEIDRRERIDVVYVQRGAELEERRGDFTAPPWPSEGDGEHSVAAQRRECERYLAAGGIALVAYADDRLVGIGVLNPHLRPDVAQLAYLYVSNGYRGGGVGGRLSDELEALALAEGHTSVVVSATPSQNTVRFYVGRGYEPMAEPFPELFDLEPEDVHLLKKLRRPED